MGRVSVKGNTRSARQRIGAIRARLENPESFLYKQGLNLSKIVRRNAPHDSGTLASAFDYIKVVREGRGRASVFIGDPSILTPMMPAPKRTIAEYIAWLRGRRYPGQPEKPRGTKVPRTLSPNEKARRRWDRQKKSLLTKVSKRKADRIKAKASRAARAEKHPLFKTSVKEFMGELSSLRRHMSKGRVRLAGVREVWKLSPRSIRSFALLKAIRSLKGKK